ncbi:hypothetical protein [Streptomyces sp. NPDC059916]|uniref:hypothetical protein n=1 Tax=Streptomyces sp. NPDC059916 TaxID=3347001 RepID=UPI00368EF5A9
MLLATNVGGFAGLVSAPRGGAARGLGVSNFPQPRGHCLNNYTSDRVSPAARRMTRRARIFGNPLTWNDLPWLRSINDLPLILKGI